MVACFFFMSVSTGVFFKADSISVIVAIDSSMEFFKLSATLFDWFTLPLRELESTDKDIVVKLWYVGYTRGVTSFFGH